jgi:WD40 repeat protein
LDIPQGNITVDGQPVEGLLQAFYGRWLGNDYFLPESGWEDRHPLDSLGFIPIFDPAARTFRNLVEYAGLPANFNHHELIRNIQISPEGDFLTVSAPNLEQIEYVLDIKTLQIKLYRVESYTVSESGEIISKLQVFSPSGKEIQPTPTHTTEIVLPIQTTQRFLSPNGNRIALLSVDGSLWLVDYPSLENLEQLTEPMPPKIMPSGGQEPRVKDISWSPDGRFLAFLGDTDIYIVDTRVTSH